MCGGGGGGVGGFRVGGWDVTPCVIEEWGLVFDRVWSKWASRVALHGYESSSEMEACGRQVPRSTSAFLIACRRVEGGGGCWKELVGVCVWVLVCANVSPDCCNSITWNPYYCLWCFVVSVVCCHLILGCNNVNFVFTAPFVHTNVVCKPYSDRCSCSDSDRDAWIIVVPGQGTKPTASGKLFILLFSSIKLDEVDIFYFTGIFIATLVPVKIVPFWVLALI